MLPACHRWSSLTAAGTTHLSSQSTQSAVCSRQFKSCQEHKHCTLSGLSAYVILQSQVVVRHMQSQRKHGGMQYFRTDIHGDASHPPLPGTHFEAAALMMLTCTAQQRLAQRHEQPPRCFGQWPRLQWKAGCCSPDLPCVYVPQSTATAPVAPSLPASLSSANPARHPMQASAHTVC